MLLTQIEMIGRVGKRLVQRMKLAHAQDENCSFVTGRKLE
jgi:hypothetical protein